MLRILFLMVLLATPGQSLSAVTLTLNTDARQITRKLVTTELEVSVEPGEVGFLYPEWIPGIHGPRNPLQNLAEVSFATREGGALPWQRDPYNAYRFIVEVPPGVNQLRVKTTYIASQPSVNSRGVDSYGNSLIGLINWNTLVLYPEGVAMSDLEVEARVELPEGWKWASSLRGEQQPSGTIRFAPVSLEVLLDSPLFSGQYLRSYALTAEGAESPVFLDVVSESEAATRVKDEILEQLQQMVEEAHELFGVFHYEVYRLMVAASDEIPGSGLEHRRSSHNVVGERAFVDLEEFQKRAAYLLPHEYAHSWCGKYRRPHGMITSDFNTPQDTRMLWVYEGLDQYLGALLTYRSGMLPFDKAEERFAASVSRYASQKGRRSISLEDTAASAYLRRGGSPQWSCLNRGQDYYTEGMFLWLEIDATLRQLTQSKVTLDDFCRQFFAKQAGEAESFGFGEDEIVRILNKLANHDWADLIASRVKTLHDELPFDFLEKLGYRITYEPEPNATVKDQEKKGAVLNLSHSLGMTVKSSGSISRVIPGSRADQAGLYDGVEIVGVGDRRFKLDRMRDALTDSSIKRSVDLLVLKGDVFEHISIPYDQGMRYLHLNPRSDRSNHLEAIWKSRTEP